MKKIGGFFEMELTEGNSVYHDSAIKLSTGRACLNYILKTMQPAKVYIPFYTCDALFEPIDINGIEYEFYAINELLEIKNLPDVKLNEMIIYIDFFGIKSKYVYVLLDLYKEKLIIDNTHSFFSRSFETGNPSFNSARKYFGVPDGAFLYIQKNQNINFDVKRNRKVSINHNLHRLMGLQEQAYSEYLDYEKKLSSDIEGMSILSEYLLSSVNYTEVRKIRNDNFNYLRNELKSLNKLKIDEDVADCFCYPLLLDKCIDRKKLFNVEIFVPSLWLDTINRNNNNAFDLECKLSNELLPLPIDHRYTIKDLKRVSDTIKEFTYE